MADILTDLRTMIDHCTDAGWEGEADTLRRAVAEVERLRNERGRCMRWLGPCKHRKGSKHEPSQE